MEITDSQQQALVRRAQNGDREAFGDLVRFYQRRVVGVAYHFLGSSEDARDVGQDAFVQAFRCLQQVKDPSRFRPWLMRTVVNLSLNFRRSRAQSRMVSLDALSVETTATCRSRVTECRCAIHGTPSAGDMQTKVAEAVESLPDHQRTALILFSVEGLPQTEVAEILRCSVELVKWNVFQARKKLKELLEDYLNP